MTCLFNARAYRDGSAAAPRRPDTSYWVLGCRGLVREHLVPRVQGLVVQGAGLPRRGTTCAGCRATAIAPQRHRESAINTFFLWPPGPAPGSCPRFLPSCPCPGPGVGYSRSHLGSNWRLRSNDARRSLQESDFVFSNLRCINQMIALGTCLSCNLSAIKHSSYLSSCCLSCSTHKLFERAVCFSSLISYSATSDNRMIAVTSHF
jgi:hypothetical protein